MRADKRKNDELREMEMKVGLLNNADGSAMSRFGKTTAIAGVYGPRNLHPRWLQESDKAFVRCYYDMSPFSVDQRKNPAPSRRSKEISMVTANALEPAIFTEEFPKTVIDIFIRVIEADAGTRCAAIIAGSLALADAGIPMRDLVSACASGVIGGKVTLDLAGKEEEETDCDLALACMPKTKKITLLQMDGKLPPARAKEVIEMCLKGCDKIYDAQKKALKERYKR